MAKRIIGKLHPERYIVQDNMLFGCIPFIYVARKVFNTGAYHPLGFMTQTDAHYLFDKVFTKEFVKEMTDRGYDVTTMKFEISPKLPNYERFNGLSEKYYGKK